MSGGGGGRVERIKAADDGLQVPETIEEASELLEWIGISQRKLVRLEASMNERIAKAKAAFEVEAKAEHLVIAKAVAGLQAWAKVNRAKLLPEGKKSFELPAGLVGWRTTPKRIVLHGKTSAIVAALKERMMTRFIRIKETVDKQALLREPSSALAVPGVSFAQGEEFFVEPFKVALAEVPAAL